MLRHRPAGVSNLALICAVTTKVLFSKTFHLGKSLDRVIILVRERGTIQRICTLLPLLETGAKVVHCEANLFASLRLAGR